jgi:hypothetical protein
MHSARLVPEVSLVLSFWYTITHVLYRCTARFGNLDGEGGRRSRSHTDLLVSELELGVLWDEYGLVGDIVVRTIYLDVFKYMNSLSCSHLQTISLGPIFTN